jgi:DNA-binding MarR family transcriptional regulator
MKITDELKQNAPLAPEVAAYLNALRTADWLSRGVTEILKPYDLSPTQYNVLRILRGAGKEGRKCGDISERLVTRDPDITRLLDRLAKRGLISRERSERDRRMVFTRITPAGLALLEELDGPIAAVHRRQFSHLDAEQLATLSRLLELVRDGQTLSSEAK